MNHSTGRLGANGGDAARRAAQLEAMRQAARQAAQRQLETSVPQAPRAPGTGQLVDRNAGQSSETLRQAHTGPLGDVPLPPPPGADDLGMQEMEAAMGSGASMAMGAASAVGLAGLLGELRGTVGDVRNPVNSTRGALISTIQELKAVENRTPAQQQTLEVLEARKLRADAAANLLGLTTGVTTLGDGLDQLADGNLVGGLTTTAEGALDVAGRGVRLTNNVRVLNGADAAALKPNDRLGSALTGAADVAAGIGTVADGIQSLREGDLIGGGLELASGTASTAAGVATAGANLTAAGRIGESTLLARFGRNAPAALGVAGVLGGAVAVNRGIATIRDGRVLEGSVQLAQGTLGSLAGSSASAAALRGLGSGVNFGPALTRFAGAANTFGGAAAVVGGGFQAFSALSADPPDLQSAAVGGANMVGGALLIAGPPTAVAGGAILLGAALYENVAPVREVVDGVVGGAAQVAGGIIDGHLEVAEGLAEGAGEVIEGFGEAADELREGDVIGAAGDVARGLAEGAGEVAEGVRDGIGEVAEGVADGAERLAEGAAEAGRSVARGAAGAARAVGGFLSGL